MAFIEIKNLTFSYNQDGNKALNNININIDKGEFILLYGISGSGKTTLLRSLKPVLAPNGVKTGEIFLDGEDIENKDIKYQVSKIGFVFQNVEDQIVTDKVWHELCFTLESLKYDETGMRLKVAEIASSFGIQDYFYKNTNELSGGQKQIVSLASSLIMNPDVLILDEPTSQLDPIAAKKFIDTLKRINQEFGTTIILSEHRLEDLFPIVDRVILIDNGEIIEDCSPRDIGGRVLKKSKVLSECMPLPVYLYNKYRPIGICPLSVREAQRWLYSAVKKSMGYRPAESFSHRREIIVECRNIWFRYKRENLDILRKLSMKIERGQIYCILGSNGSGKTTLLKILCGILKPYRGKISINRKLNFTYIPQNVKLCFNNMTVREELFTTGENTNYVLKIIDFLKLRKVLECHPYDISQGEQQKLALAKAILSNSEVLFFDEPVKALDTVCKEEISKLFNTLSKNGVTIIIVSHDLEFCAENATKCALLFDGNIVSEGQPKKFFSSNNFYTTIANRISRHISNEIVTKSELIEYINDNINIY